MRRGKLKRPIPPAKPKGWMPSYIAQEWEIITERGKILKYLEGTYSDVQWIFIDYIQEHDKENNGVHLFRKGHGKAWVESLKHNDNE